jgi:hypothetical protein
VTILILGVSMQRIVTVHLAPSELTVDGCRVAILEALKTKVLDEELHHIVVAISCKGVHTKPFTIDARTPREFRAKLKAEIAKLKMLIYMYDPKMKR